MDIFCAADAQLQSALNAALAEIPVEERENDNDGEDDADDEEVGEAVVIDD